MKLDFATDNVQVIEFGVGRDDGDAQTFCLLPVDHHVQSALREMIGATCQAMRNLNNSPQKYNPAEKYDRCEYVHLPLNDGLADRIRDLHQANNLDLDPAALEEPENIFCYFTRMTDANKRRLTALRRATQFKGVLKSRLICLVSDALKLVEERLFKLDGDFDLLVDAGTIHILRPSGFEFAGNLQKAVLAAVPHNILEIQKDLKFVEFGSIQGYAIKHPRAARYLASIRSQTGTKNIDKSALKKLCKSTGVAFTESKGKITVLDGYEMGFLEVLDRRRYELKLVKGSPEQFKASSRRKIEK